MCLRSLDIKGGFLSLFLAKILIVRILIIHIDLSYNRKKIVIVKRIYKVIRHQRWVPADITF